MILYISYIYIDIYIYIFSIVFVEEDDQGLAFSCQVGALEGHGLLESSALAGSWELQPRGVGR